MAARMKILFCFLGLTILTQITVSVGVYPFQNPSLPIDKRVSDLISRLTLPELAAQLQGAGGGGTHGGNPSPAIPRLGIKRFVWSAECLRGDAMAGNATSFPQAIGLAATFSRDTIFKVASATAAEVRAKNNDFVRRGVYHDHTGLGCFSPVVNIMRHPLWGRNQETYGEDPFLTGELSAAFVKGLQGSHPRYLAAAATCKHFDAYNGPENLPVPREHFDAKVSEFDLHMTFLPQFQSCLRAGANGVMCSYNSVNGVHACVNPHLLTDVLRTEMKFQGYVVSDAGALEFSVDSSENKYAETAAAALKAGLNLELQPDGYNTTVFGAIPQAVKSGLINESLVRERAIPVFTTRMRLGEFDPPNMNPYLKYSLNLIESHPHQQLSIAAAIQSLVLLKNDGILPLKTRVGRLGLVGPFANNLKQIMGDYSADTDEVFIKDVVSGVDISEIASFTSGCNDTRCQVYWPHFVKEIAASSDLMIVCLGTGQAVETENVDRANIMLPGKQGELLNDVIAYAKGKIILLLFSGGPLDIRTAVASPKVAAILQCFFPAQATGIALQSVLTLNSTYSNPAGRLPFTWYLSQNEVFNMTDYSMKNKTYRYYTGKPLFPFGFGLSYTTFNYSHLDIDRVKVKAGQDVTFTLRVSNIGKYDGDEVVMVYMSWLNKTIPAPQLQLAAFERVHVPVGQTIKLLFTISARQMAVWQKGKGYVVNTGQMMLITGPQPPTHPSPKVKAGLLRATFTILP